MLKYAPYATDERSVPMLSVRPLALPDEFSLSLGPLAHDPRLVLSIARYHAARETPRTPRETAANTRMIQRQRSSGDADDLPVMTIGRETWSLFGNTTSIRRADRYRGHQFWLLFFFGFSKPIGKPILRFSNRSVDRSCDFPTDR